MKNISGKNTTFSLYWIAMAIALAIPFGMLLGHMIFGLPIGLALSYAIYQGKIKKKRDSD